MFITPQQIIILIPRIHPLCSRYVYFSFMYIRIPSTPKYPDHIKAHPTMHRTTAMIPPTPKLAVLVAAPVKVAALGLTGDALAAVAGVVYATGRTLMVWT
jgi:hypothetical protein